MLEKMSSQQRLLLATAISILFFIGYTAIFPPKNISQIEQNSSLNSQSQNTNTNSTVNQNNITVNSAPKIGTSTVTTSSLNLTDTIVTISYGSEATMTIDKFGRISSKTLLAQKYKNDSGIQAQLVSTSAGTPKPLEIRFEDAKLNSEAFSISYISNRTEINISKNSEELILTQNLSDEIVVTKKIVLYPTGNYDITVSLSKPKKFFISNGMRPEASEYGFVVQGGMVRVADENTIFEDNDVIGSSVFRNLTFASSFDRYYASIFYKINSTTTLVVDGDINKNPNIYLEGLDNLTFSGYLGPKDHKILKALDEELVSAIEYGLITMIAKPIFFVLNWFHSMFGNWGWAIVALTILIRFILYPLTHKGMVSMQKLKELAPELKEIQRKHKDNPQQLQAKMMELYSKNGANPMGGCLPILLQIPIFFAIYRVLLNAVELQGEGWIFWIEDLAKMDPYFILPILMGGTMFWQQHITPTNFTDPMQEKIFKFLPLIFTFFFITFPAGLTLYWFVNNLFSISQQYFVNKHFSKIKSKK
jgi:YidC/Oxa1 family membrane protein insertase